MIELIDGMTQFKLGNPFYRKFESPADKHYEVYSILIMCLIEFIDRENGVFPVLPKKLGTHPTCEHTHDRVVLDANSFSKGVDRLIIESDSSDQLSAIRRLTIYEYKTRMRSVLKERKEDIPSYLLPTTRPFGFKFLMMAQLEQREFIRQRIAISGFELIKSNFRTLSKTLSTIGVDMIT